MATITKDLGAVTAYGYAVEQGYTGTEEEYAALMADYATVAEEAADSAEAAEASATQAAASATQAGQSATNAASSASAAGTSASNAQTAAQGAAQSKTDAAGSATAAANSASQAAGSATGAAASATAASGSATAAEASKTAAQTAQTAAETAQTGAETAQGAAEDAQTAAETAAASVTASAEQIETNRTDIANLKSDFTHNVGDCVLIYASELYPFTIQSGAQITVEEASGLELPTAVVYFYNKSKNAVGSAPIGSTYGKSRTFVLSTSETIKYVYLNTTYAPGIRVYVRNNGDILTRLDNAEKQIDYINPDVMGYITSTDDLYAVFNGSNWYFKASLFRLYRGNQAAFNITWDSIVSKFSGSYIGSSPDGTTNCLVLSDGRYLYYDWDNSTFDIASNIAAVPVHATILLAQLGQQPYGVMWDYLNTTETKRVRFNAVGNILTTVTRFAEKLVDKSSNIARFGFFSDPHWLEHAPSTNYDKLNKLMQECLHLYHSAPIEFMCCGGDWLNNGGTKQWAITTLGYIQGMTHRFKKFYNVVGNHDTNYIIGTELSHDEIANGYGVNYYTFDEGVTHYVVLDTGTDDNSPTSMDAYKWEQIAWLSKQLNNHDNTVIILHAPVVGSSSDGYYVSEFAKNITALADAFNKKSSIVLNDTTYDFSGANGKVWCLLGGHQHANYHTKYNDIHIYIVANSSTALNCYLTAIDFDNGTISFTSTLDSAADWEGNL